jgi:hypothetical protein
VENTATYRATVEKYYRNDEVKKDKLGRACSAHDEKRILVGKPEGMRPLEILRRRWEDNIKTVHKEIVWGYMD